MLPKRLWFPKRETGEPEMEVRLVGESQDRDSSPPLCGGVASDCKRKGQLLTPSSKHEPRTYLSLHAPRREVPREVVPLRLLPKVCRHPSTPSDALHPSSKLRLSSSSSAAVSSSTELAVPACAACWRARSSTPAASASTTELRTAERLGVGVGSGGGGVEG